MFDIKYFKVTDLYGVWVHSVLWLFYLMLECTCTNIINATKHRLQIRVMIVIKNKIGY